PLKAAVGVPVKAPVDLSKVMPAGNVALPLVIAKLSTGPPVKVGVRSTGTPTTQGVSVSGGVVPLPGFSQVNWPGAAATDSKVCDAFWFSYSSLIQSALRAALDMRTSSSVPRHQRRTGLLFPSLPIITLVFV